VELKRFLKPFPVSMLPEEMLVDIIDFLGAKDLVSAALTCTTLFKKIEKKSKELVESVQHLFPNGPILKEECESLLSGETMGTLLSYASGRNSHRLRVPEDGKCWLKVLEKMERLTVDTYFGFQVKSGDQGCAMRYLRSNNRIAFGQAYCSTNDGGIVPHLPGNDVSVTGGQVMVKRFRLSELTLHHREDRNAANGRFPKSVIFSVDKELDSGVHRVIFRYYCHYERDPIGKVGILTRTESSAEWLGSFDVEMSSNLGITSEEIIIGLEFDSNNKKLTVFATDQEEKKIKDKAQFDIPEEANNICFAASLSNGSALSGGNQMSIRSCDNRDWGIFLSLNPNNNLKNRGRGHSRHDRVDLRMRRRIMRARPEFIDLHDLQDDEHRVHRRMLRVRPDIIDLQNLSDEERPDL
jgi:hypothetical protein